MDRSNPHHHRRYIPLYCSQATQTCHLAQTHSGSEGDAEYSDSDFPPIKIGKNMSLASAACRGSQQLSLSKTRHHQQSNIVGLGQTNKLNVVDATPPARNRKVTALTPNLGRYSS
jgi:hypothetical protein